MIESFWFGPAVCIQKWWETGKMSWVNKLLLKHSKFCSLVHTLLKKNRIKSLKLLKLISSYFTVSWISTFTDWNLELILNKAVDRSNSCCEKLIAQNVALLTKECHAPHLTSQLMLKIIMTFLVLLTEKWSSVEYRETDSCLLW